MEKYGSKTTRKFRGRSVSSLAIGSTYDLASRWTEILKAWKPKAIAQRIGASPRTVENWQDGANGPTWKHTVARGDLAKHQETIAALKAALVSEGK